MTFFVAALILRTATVELYFCPSVGVMFSPMWMASLLRRISLSICLSPLAWCGPLPKPTKGCLGKGDGFHVRRHVNIGFRDVVSVSSWPALGSGYKAVSRETEKFLQCPRRYLAFHISSPTKSSRQLKSSGLCWLSTTTKNRFGSTPMASDKAFTR